MRSFYVIILLSLCFLPATGEAQIPAATPREAMLAEHKTWVVDARQWTLDHQEAASRLTKIAKSLRLERSQIIMNDREIAIHGRSLTALRDTSELDAEHARLRAAHNAAKAAHIKLLAAVAALQSAVQNDEATNAAEGAIR